MEVILYSSFDQRAPFPIVGEGQVSKILRVNQLRKILELLDIPAPGKC